MGKKIKKVLITTGLITLMALSSTGCSKGETMPTSAPVQTEATTEADLDIQVNVPTTEVDMGDGLEKAEILETESDGTYTGKLDNGDTFTTVNVPKLEDKSFTEEQSILFEAITRVWGIKSDEEKVALGRGGLIELIKESFLDYTDSEYELMADHILSQYPIPEIATAQPESKSSTEVKSETKAETKANSSSTANSSNTAQPAPQPQPTQAPQTPEPQAPEPQTGVNDWNEGDWKANLSEADRAIIEGLADSAKDVDVLDNSNDGPGHSGYDGSGDINLGGGM